MWLTLVVTNIGEKDFEFSFGGDNRGTGRHDRIKVTVTDREGDELPDPHANAPQFGGPMTWHRLGPKGPGFSTAIDLTKYRTIAGPGRYRVSCQFAFDEPFTPKKGSAMPVVASSFPLTILARTPERVSSVLDELEADVATSLDDQLPDVMAAIARFGQAEALPRLGTYTNTGTARQRTAALAALPLISHFDTLAATMGGIHDSDPAIRAAAFTAIGQISGSRSVDILLGSLPGEETPVRAAILLALGNTKAAIALPSLRASLADHSPAIRSAAVAGLVHHGGPNAVAALQSYVESPDLRLRYEVVEALTTKLDRPLDTKSLIPILMCRRHNNPEWLGAANLVRMYGGERAVPLLLSCLDFDVAWSHRNSWLLHYVEAAKHAPKFTYAYDPNSSGTPEQHEQNRHTLEMLKELSGPPPPIHAWPSERVPDLKTDPPIDFTVKLSTRKGSGEQPATVTCGFFRKNWNRNGGSVSFSPSEAYLSTYQIADKVRTLLASEAQAEALGLNEQQLRALRELDMPSAYPETEESWTLLYIWWQESPVGPLRGRAHNRLCEQVRAAVQRHHTEHVTFAAAAQAIMAGNERSIPKQARQQQRVERPKLGDQRIHPSMRTSSRWLDLKRRLEAGPVKHNWVAVNEDGVCQLDLGGTPTSNLSHLQGAPLEYLNVANTAVRDLTPLRGMPLRQLDLSGSRVSSLAGLEGTKLHSISLSFTQVRDLRSLKHAKLTSFVAIRVPLDNLSALSGMPLEYVDLRGTRVTDLSPLINDRLRSVQVESSPIRDLSPLRQARLDTLWLGNFEHADLNTLKGMSFDSLTLKGPEFSDVSALSTMRIKHLWLNTTNVRDLTPLKGLNLSKLSLAGSPVTDLTPLAELKLTSLFLSTAELTTPGIDLSPLANMPLEEIGFPDVSRVTNLKVLRTIESLKWIKTVGKPVPAAQFWQRYDAGRIEDR